MAIFTYTPFSSSDSSAGKPVTCLFNGTNVDSLPVTFCAISVPLCSFHGNYTEPPEVVYSSFASRSSVQASILLPCAQSRPPHLLTPRNYVFVRLNPKQYFKCVCLLSYVKTEHGIISQSSNSAALRPIMAVKICV